MRPFCRFVDSTSLRVGHCHLSHPRSFAPARRCFHPLSPSSRVFPRQPHFRRISTYVYSRASLPRQSAVDPLSLLLAISIVVGAGYVARTYILPSNKEAAAAAAEDPEKVETVTFSSAYPDMPTQIPPGRPGALTPEQEVKLKEFWLATLDVFGVTTADSDAASIAASGTSTPTQASETKDKKKSRLSLFKKHNKDTDSTDSVSSANDDDKHGQNKEFREALATTSPEALRSAFWSMVKHDDPDALLLRFLRARKWDIQAALVMLVATMHWRKGEMHVDDDIMINGEMAAYKASKTATGAQKKDGDDFLAQLRLGKSVLHGVDKEGRPVVVVRVRLHKAGEQTEPSLERYTVYTIETARMLLRGNVDTATIIFDMTSFSMANMDYAPVKFMIKCFEANYPESLGSVLVYKAPWIFQGIWKIIRGWLDPVVASKIHFCSNIDELGAFIPRSRILKELGGDEDYEYKYPEPVEGENSIMDDHAGKEKLESARRDMALTYEKDTIAWARGNSKGDERSKIKDALKENYWQLDPYVRARSLYDRFGLLGRGGELNFYPNIDASKAANDDLD